VLTFDATIDASSVRYQMTGQQGGDRDGLLGMLGTPVAEFPSLSLAPSNSFAYSAAQVDLLATWNYLLNAVDALAPRQQLGMIQGVLAMAEGLLGMPVGELMAAWGREYAQYSFVDAAGAPRSVYVLGLRDREQVLAALRQVAAQKVVFLPIEEIPAAEGAAAETAYFHFLSAPTEENEEPKPTFHLAVAGNWLLASERQEDLQAALGRAGGGSPFLGQSPVFQQARSRFPAALSGFSYLDAERWLQTDAARELFRTILEGVAQRSAEREKEAEAETTPEAEADPNAEADADAAPPEDEPPQAEEPPIPFPELQIPRGYLKWLLSATTRDAHSFRVTGIIE
jgi:hypothetical protein